MALSKETSIFNPDAIGGGFEDAAREDARLAGLVGDVNTLLTELQGKLGTYFQFREETVDGTTYPVLVLGGGTSPLTARLSSGKLAFIQDGAEVAWISDLSLHITRAEIVESLSFPSWIWEQRQNGNLTLKWTGGAV